MAREFFKKYRQLNWAMADQAMVSGVNFLTSILFARFLGIEEFGRFTLVWMAVLFVNSIQMAMISTPMMSIGPKQAAQDEPAYYGAVAAQQLCFAGLSFILTWAGVKISHLWYPDWRIEHLALPLAAVAFFFQNQDFLRRLFFTRGRQAAAFVNDAISYLGQIVVLIALFFTSAPDAGCVLWAIAITSAIAVFAGIVLLAELVWSPAHAKRIFLRHWQFSKWMTASALLQWTSGNFFLVAAGGMLGSSAVGAIKAAQNIMAVSHVLFQGMENIVPARASWHYSQRGIEGLKLYLQKVAWWGGLATAIMALLAASFPQWWLSLFYGEAYLGYAYVLQWYAAIYLLIFLGLPLRAGLRALESVKPIFTAYVLMSAFSLATANYLVGSFGIIGVMSGIMATQLISQCSLLYSLRCRWHNQVL